MGYSVAVASLPDTCYRYGLLLAEENPGNNDPEGEESCESSGGGDGYHWLASSEIVVTLVSGQVVTSRLRRCKIFVTRRFPPRLTPPSGISLCSIAAKKSPHAGSVIPAQGDRREASIASQRYRAEGGTLFAVALGELPRQDHPQREQSQERACSSQSKHLTASRNMS